MSTVLAVGWLRVQRDAVWLSCRQQSSVGILRRRQRLPQRVVSLVGVHEEVSAHLGRYAGCCSEFGGAEVSYPGLKISIACGMLVW